MAVDTRQKRFSMLGLGRMPPPVLFEADGTVDDDDIAHLLGLYSGITISSLTAENFPTVESVTTATGAYVATIGVNWPVSIAAGDVFVFCVAADVNNTATFTPSVTMTSLGRIDTFSSTGSSGEVFTYTAAGTETGQVSFLLQNDDYRGITLVMYHLSGASSAEGGTATDGDSTSPAFSAFQPSWSQTKTLWIPFVQSSDDGGQVTTFGTNYNTNGGNVTGGYAGNQSNIAHSYRENEAVSESPDAWTLGSAEKWASKVVAVEPQAGGSGNTPVEVALATDSIAFTGSTIGVNDHIYIAAVAGAFAFTGANAVIVQQNASGNIIQLQAKVVELVGSNLGYSQAANIGLSPGSIAFTGANLDSSLAHSVALGAGSIAFTGANLVAYVPIGVDTGAGTLRFTGTNLTIDHDIGTVWTPVADSENQWSEI